MADAVGICNSALQKIGASPIMALTDGSRNAGYCAEQYPKLRDKLLRQHVWNFAKARVRLARTKTPPASGFAHAFQLPADWLRTVSVHDNAAERGVVVYSIQGQTLLSNAEALYLVYVRAVTDVNRMDAIFREALASLLAKEAAIPLANSRSLRDDMMREHRADLGSARSIDAVEDYPESFPAGSWETARW